MPSRCTIAESLVVLIEDEGRSQGFVRVKQICVKLGALGHGVSHGTIAEGARLELETVRGAVGRCRSQSAAHLPRGVRARTVYPCIKISCM